MIPNICIYEQLMFERVQEWQKEAERKRLIRSARVERELQRNAMRTTRAAAGEQPSPAVPLFYH